MLLERPGHFYLCAAISEWWIHKATKVDFHFHYFISRGRSTPRCDQTFYSECS